MSTTQPDEPPDDVSSSFWSHVRHVALNCCLVVGVPFPTVVSTVSKQAHLSALGQQFAVGKRLTHNITNHNVMITQKPALCMVGIKLASAFFGSGMLCFGHIYDISSLGTRKNSATAADGRNKLCPFCACQKRAIQHLICAERCFAVI